MVFTSSSVRKLVTDPANGDYITAVEAISAAGGSIPPMIHFKGGINKWMGLDDVNDDNLLATSDSTFSKDALVLDWLKCFGLHRRKVQKEVTVFSFWMSIVLILHMKSGTLCKMQRSRSSGFLLIQRS
jgi:hypothetical protein